MFVTFRPDLGYKERETIIKVGDYFSYGEETQPQRLVTWKKGGELKFMESSYSDSHLTPHSCTVPQGSFMCNITCTYKYINKEIMYALVRTV